MIRIAPFKALRYNPEAISFISRVVAPPYDVISQEDAQALRDGDPHNVIRLTLGKVGKDGRSNEEYARAAEVFAEWLRDGVLIRDDAPGVYVCEQAFSLDGKHYVRRGLICAMLLEEFSSGSVLPHEHTMAGPKDDRLRLMTACRANLSQVFGVFSDAEGRVDALLGEMARGIALYEFRGADAVAYQVWRIEDPEFIGQVAALLRGETLLIADGHHRYETALHYRQLYRRDDAPPGDALEDFLPIFCVSAKNPGLKVLATHRLVKAPAGSSLQELLTLLAATFDVAEASVGGPEDLKKALDPSSFNCSAIACYVHPQRLLVLRPKTREALDAFLPDRVPEWRSLPVTWLHYAILDPLFGIPAETESGHPCLAFTHDVEDLYWAVESGRFDAAFLLPPIAPAVVERIASTGERMPPKSTFFYPKIATGLILYGLGAEDSVPQIPQG
ncbi:MAG: DUF1015 domain-containing protein [Planctomycetota bacterium]